MQRLEWAVGGVVHVMQRSNSGEWGDGSSSNSTQPTKNRAPQSATAARREFPSLQSARGIRAIAFMRRL